MWNKTNKQLTREFKFDTFDEAIDFINKIAKIARHLNHHPTIENTFNSVTLILSTHDAGDTVTEKDQDFADKVDQMLAGESFVKDEMSEAKNGYKMSDGKVRLYADGGSRGNPGPSATGVALLAEDDTVLFKGGEYLGVTTNNQAEYQALKLGLEKAKKLNVHEVEVFMDSMLVVNQMKGVFKVKNRDLWPIHQAIKDLAKEFKSITYTHVPRELNKIADAEVNIILDSELKK